MALALLTVGFLSTLSLGYFFYGKWVSSQLQLDADIKTPAHLRADGVDYVPTPPFYLFGQHFSAIAAAGPIAGPILACQFYGWGPCLLWIALGVVAVGAVHDLATLTASVRHEACSIAEVARRQISHPAGTAMMVFIWIALVYVVVAFTDITASSFISAVEEIQGVAVDFNPGGAVAAASVLYLSLAIVLGVVQRYLKPSPWLVTLIFVPLVFVSAYAGVFLSYFFVLDLKIWIFLIAAYCALASVLPVWLLLQPRGFLGGFILYFALAVGVIGIFFGDYEIKQPFFRGWGVAGGELFPFLFVTIACGACSGFHGLVCSGTTSKQIARETHAHPIGYGAMLAEAFVAFVALSVVMVASDDQVRGLKPGTIYGNGIGEFLTLILGKEHRSFAITLGAMVFSTFVFDTIDVATRLGRYIFQDLTGFRGRFGVWAGTALTTALPLGILITTPAGGWTRFWTLFGASNQLLAALTLLTITVWLYRARKRIAYTLVPMLFVLFITLTALTQIVRSTWFNFQSLVALILIAIAIYLVAQAWLRVRSERT